MTNNVKPLGPDGLPVASMSGTEYNLRNQELFSLRAQTVKDLGALTKKPSKSAAVARKVNKLRKDLEKIDTKIVMLNYGLVINYVKKFTASSTRDDSRDFEGAAVVGLMRAINSYNPKYGSKFSTWAYKPIQRECLKAVVDADFKQLNPGDFEKRPDILRAAKKVELAGKGPAGFIDYAAIAKESGASIEAIKRVLHSPALDSLSRPLGDEGEGDLGETVVDPGSTVEDLVLNKQEVTSLERYGLSSLDDREMYVIVRRYGLDGDPVQRLSAIGSHLKLSREAVRQIEAKALSKLNHPVVRRKLVRYGKL